MSGFIAAWLSPPFELEIAVSVIAVVIVGVFVIGMRRSPSDPLCLAKARMLADAARWLGIIALLLGVFGAFLMFDRGLSRVAVDPESGRVDFEESFRCMSRLLGFGAAVCAAGFLASWALAARFGRGGSRG